MRWLLNDKCYYHNLYCNYKVEPEEHISRNSKIINIHGILIYGESLFC